MRDGKKETATSKNIKMRYFYWKSNEKYISVLA